MNRFLIYACAIFMAAATSCTSSGSSSEASSEASSDQEIKTLSPKSTEFQYGEVSKYVTVVDQPYELKLVQKENSNRVTLKITLQMVKDGIKVESAQDIGLISLLCGLTVQLLDNEGVEVHDMDLIDTDHLTLKKLLSGKKGDTAEVTFEYGTWNEHAVEAYKAATAFTPYGSSDIYLEQHDHE